MKSDYEARTGWTVGCGAAAQEPNVLLFLVSGGFWNR